MSLLLFAGVTFANGPAKGSSNEPKNTPHLALDLTKVDGILVDTCLTFLGGPWNDFNTAFGGAPVANSEGVCAFNEITDFQVWASEAYLVENFVAGVTYTFSMCNGAAGAWSPELVILDEDDNVVAHALDTCAISWTATYNGSYAIGINEAGLCGDASTNTQTDNGFPALTCEGAPPASDTCSVFLGGPYNDFNTAFGGAPQIVDGICQVNQITDFQTWASESYVIENFQEGVTYSFNICDGDFGAWVPELAVIDSNGVLVARAVDTCSISWTAAYTGTYFVGINEAGACGAASSNTQTDNGFPTLTCEGISSTQEPGNFVFAVFPNPNNGAFAIENNGEFGAYLVEVFDMTGKSLYREKVQLDGRTQVNTNIATAGTYLVKLTDIKTNTYRSLRMIIE